MGEAVRPSLERARAPGENFALRMGRGLGLPCMRVLRPRIYGDRVVETEETGDEWWSEWKRALPVPRGSWERMGLT